MTVRVTCNRSRCPGYDSNDHCPRCDTNRYVENPHPPGTMLAAVWDLGRSVSDLVETVVTVVSSRNTPRS